MPEKNQENVPSYRNFDWSNYMKLRTNIKQLQEVQIDMFNISIWHLCDMLLIYYIDFY